MVWEIVFMLVILKIPMVYLCVVVWWAIKAEPVPPDLEEPAVVPDTPASGGPQRGRRTSRPRPDRPHAPGRGGGAARIPQRGGARS
jgi:hypothetical protein